MEFQVRSPRGEFVVDLLQRTCACGRWQLSGIPCSHAISCILHNKDKPENYVDSCYHMDTYMMSYAYPIHAHNDANQWPKSTMPPLQAPKFDRRKRGRRQTKRRKEAWELEVQRKDKQGIPIVALSKEGGKQHCSVCGKNGHNKRFHTTRSDSTTANDTLVEPTGNRKVHFFVHFLVRPEY
ncbi:unnamed protein product [Linum trigynum]|uniref:SWIM-type domain-containing protein n=1 Tax=Linum trigynum TaxID=586398 RepID=A0AAV2E0E0_9ROSI